MESVWQLINEWEIQLLVVVSFILQVFLFFTGSLRRSCRSPFLRVTIWVAYLGADVVAIYALGSLSRHKDASMDNNNGLTSNNPLPFLWAAFLLIHLGGQDTITAFALEDNKLWLRHMLNMVTQVALALYVFWKSGIWDSMWLLLLGIFLFIPGIIKYGERTLALMYGNLGNDIERESSSKRRWRIPPKGPKDGYEGYICFALEYFPLTKTFFAGRVPDESSNVLTNYSLGPIQIFKLFDVECCIMYSDLYTKTRLLRTTSGVVLRLVSLVSTIIALVLFTVNSSKVGGYGTVADIVITYTLLYGGLLLEVCAVLMMFLASPWTWAWLGGQKYKCLARMSKSLLSWGSFGLQETRPLWSNTMGQYSFLSYLGYDQADLNMYQRVMAKIRKVARRLGVGEAKKLFWLSKLLDSKHVAVDDNIRECLVQEVHNIRSGESRRPWRHLGSFVTETVPFVALNLTYFIGTLHLITEAYLNDKVATSGTGGDDKDDDDLANTCRKLSNYMFYLVVAHSASATFLQIATGSPEDGLESLCDSFTQFISKAGSNASRDAILREISNELPFPETRRRSAELRKEALEEVRDMWVRLLLYAAGKSRAAEHAAQLARGGELLTFVWLLMDRHDLGDFHLYRIELARNGPSRGIFNLTYVTDPQEGSEDKTEDNTNTEISQH